MATPSKAFDQLQDLPRRAIAQTFCKGNSMQCLTNPELISWLCDHSIPREPYENRPEQAFFLQFSAPRSREDMHDFLTAYYASVIGATESVVQLVEWIQSEPPGDRIFAIRRQHGDSRFFSDAPSHRFDATESKVAVELAATAAFGSLSTYVYSAPDRSTLYLWEGDIFDFWTDSREVYEFLLVLIQRSGLKQMGN